MKTLKLSKTLVLAGMGVATLAMAAQEGTLLRRKLEENTTDKYAVTRKVQQTLTIPGMGEQDMTVNSTGTYTLKTNKVDPTADTADVESTIDNKVEMDGSAAAMVPPPKMKPVTLKGKMDGRGRITFEQAAANDMMSMMMAGSQSSSSADMFVELPEKAVKVGDTWDVIVPKSPFTLPEDQKLTAKLVGEREVDGRKVWVVSVTGTLKSDVDTSKLPKDPKASSDNPISGMTVHVKATTDMTGEGLVDQETGKTLSMTSSGKMKSNIELVEMGANIDTTGTYESTVKLEK